MVHSYSTYMLWLSQDTYEQLPNHHLSCAENFFVSFRVFWGSNQGLLMLGRYSVPYYDLSLRTLK